LNDYLTEVVTKSVDKDKIVIIDNHLIQKKDPIFVDASTESPLSFRTHFYAPTKNFFGNLMGTFGFNILIIWSFTILLYISLYFDLFKKAIEFFGSIQLKKTN
jgi:hypothetical protein